MRNPAVDVRKGVGGLNFNDLGGSNRMGFLARIFFRRAGVLIFSKDNQTNQNANEYGAFSRCVAPNGADFSYLFSFAFRGRNTALEKLPRNSGGGVGRPPSERMR
jgi:hypothetical protein